MIRGWRGLGALAALTIGLALVVALSGGAVPLDRSLLLGFDSERVTQLRWSRPGSSDVSVLRTGGDWRFSPPQRNMVDPRRVDAVLATLRGARWQRRAPRDRAGAIRSTLAIQMGARATYSIGFGEVVQGADQVWVVRESHAYLIDGWVVRALVLEGDAVALCDCHPLRRAASGDVSIRIDRGGKTLNIEPGPWRDARGWIAPGVVEPLIAALAKLHIVRLSEGGGQDVPRTQFVLRRCSDGERCSSEAAPIDSVAVGGACAGGQHLIELISANGSGCVEESDWKDVVAAIAALDAPLDQVLDRRPVAGDTVAIKLTDGVIRLDKRPVVEFGGAVYPADLERVGELAAALAAPGDIVALPPGRPDAGIEVTLRSGVTVALSRYGATVVRSAESVGLRVSMAPTLFRSAQAYVDPTRWMEDISTVRTVSIVDVVTADDRNFLRGAVLGEWLRDGRPVSAPMRARVEAVAQAAATVRAPSAEVPRGWSPRRILTVAFAPPVGEPRTHRLELGDPGSGGCIARIDGVGSLAPATLCSAVAAVK